MFHFIGVSHAIENQLAERVKPYAEWREKRDKLLVAPDHGVLVGRVLDIKPEKELMIVDFMGAKWVVDISKAVSKNDFKPQIGHPVGLIGEKVKEGEFRADRVLPFRPKNLSGAKPRMFMPTRK